MTVFNSMKWDLGTSGDPLKGSVRNANLALQELGWGTGAQVPAALSMVQLHTLASKIEFQQKFRPTVKALREAVKQLRDGELAPQDKRGDRAPAQRPPADHDVCVGCGAKTEPKWAIEFADGDRAAVCEGCFNEQEALNSG